MKSFAHMSFEEFANAIKPSGAANRLPSLGVGEDVHTYSVYMNGPLAEKMPLDVQQFEFKDVMLYALTEKLKLNSQSFRDNLKVAEVVATRNAWMASVLEAAKDQSVSLSDKVMDDYGILTNGLTHPWILNELENQRVLSSGLKPALDSASTVVGKAVKDRAPGELSSGVVVSQSTDFTMQALLNGEVVTHENRRLESIPKIGDDVTISYYRGNGQVFGNHEKLRVSSPYIDKTSGDLAVALIDESGRPQKVVLFNSMSSFAKFVMAQGLDTELLETAVNVRVATPKIVVAKEIGAKELLSDVYVDKRSGCLSVDYKENNAAYSVLFGSAMNLESRAKEFGLNSNHIALAKSLELKQQIITPEVEAKSLDSLVGELAKLGIQDIADQATDKRAYTGKVVAGSALHVAQDMGRGVVMIHDKRDLDKLPNIGDTFSVKYDQGKGKVADLVRDPSKGIGR